MRICRESLTVATVSASVGRGSSSLDNAVVGAVVSEVVEVLVEAAVGALVGAVVGVATAFTMVNGARLETRLDTLPDVRLPDERVELPEPLSRPLSKPTI